MPKNSKMNFVTKEYLDSALGFIVDKIGEWFEELKKDINGMKKDINGMKKDINGMKKDINGMKQDIGELKTGQVDIKRQLNDLKMDTPTQKEFDNLREKVDHFHPLY